jgi:cation transport ATPase
MTKLMTKMKPSDAPPPASAPERGGQPVAAVPMAGTPNVAPGPIGAKVTRKPMARAIRIALFQREIRERLSPAALDLVFARVEVISEGQRALRNGSDSYFGSTMLTIDLPALGAYLRDACDAGTARRLAALLEGDAGVARRIQELAEQEATRVAGAVPKQVGAHVVIRSQGAKVFVDVDVEAVFV